MPALARVAPLLDAMGDWPVFLGSGLSEEELVLFRRHERNGRPLGSEGFVTRLENLLCRVLRAGKPGPRGPWKHKKHKDRNN